MSKHLPHWPAMMLRQDAAAYCGLSIAAFEREVMDGRLPESVILGDKAHWHKEALDENLRIIAGLEEAKDWRRRLYA